MQTANCGATEECSGGVCVCAAGTSGRGADSIHQISSSAVSVVDMAVGDQSLFLALVGVDSSILRFALPNGPQTFVDMALSDRSLYALDAADPMDNPIWCSEVRPRGAKTGELWVGGMQLETGRCTHVRRRGNQLYYLGDALYRRGLEPGARREMVSTEADDEVRDRRRRTSTSSWTSGTRTPSSSASPWPTPARSTPS